MDLSPVRALFDAGNICVRIITHEEPEVLGELSLIAQSEGLDTWVWSVTQGLRPALGQAAPIADTEHPAAALVWLRANCRESSAVFLLDIAEHLSDARTARAMRELLEHFRARQIAGVASSASARLPGAGRHARIVMLDHSDALPAATASLACRWEPPPPTDPELESIIRETVNRLHRLRPVAVNFTKGDLRSAVETLRGLTRRQAASVIAEVTAGDRTLDAADLKRMIEAKRRHLESAGVLEFVDAPASMDDIGGLSRLKVWLAQRAEAFGPDAARYGVDPPRGVLLLGVQGSGKSLAAKAIATAWRRPLMRLDPGALYDKYIGESERRLREALKQAEAMSPVVLWIDEIEKGFASAASTSNDGGLSRRMFGSLLTWMQEHSAPVFLVATANDIEALPPELLRKGRFDEIFFVDLPVGPVRRQIFEIHLRRRKIDPAGIDLAALAAAADGFSGAEIEQAVLSALHAAMARREPPGTLSTEAVLEAVRTSPPLSVTMAEDIAELRAWAKGRCVPADA